jgi:hypothetical protein
MRRLTKILAGGLVVLCCQGCVAAAAPLIGMGATGVSGYLYGQATTPDKKRVSVNDYQKTCDGFKAIVREHPDLKETLREAMDACAAGQPIPPIVPRPR